MNNESTVTTGVFGGAIGALLVWLIGLTGVEVPPEMAVVMGTIVTGIIQWVAPSDGVSEVMK